MRPATAVSKKSQSSSRSIWKKYQSAKPQKNNFYCFKTITQILDGHQKKVSKEDKRELYYQRVNEPNKLLQQNTLQKQNYHKRTSHQLQRNPTLKKVMSNNFFSTKQIAKQNTDGSNIFKIKTQNQIKNDTKFLPYRQQSISIIKHSKILNETQSLWKQQEGEQKMNKVSEQITLNKKSTLKKRQKNSKADLFATTHKQIKQKELKGKNEFVIQQWDNFQEQNSNFSMLITNGNRFN